MKTIWKLLGAAALVVGLTPYHVEKDEDTGAKKYQALLWQATKTPKGDGENDSLDITIGLHKPEEEEEPHLFSDELCVEYTGTPVTEESAPEAPAVPAEPEEPAAPAEPAEPEVPAESAPEEVLAEENKEEA